MQSKIRIFESGKQQGVFSRNKKFYPANFTKNDRTKQFYEVKNIVGREFGFDGKKIFQAEQKNDNNKLEYPNGKYIVLDESHMTKEDYWEESLEADILILEEKYKGIVVGNQMADCPIIIAEDRRLGITALSHCGASYIDRLLPQDTVKALIKEFNSNIEDIYIYVGSCAKKEHYIYDRYPLWANNKNIWKDNIIESSDGFHINMNGAIRIQLEDLGVIHIEESDIDTMTDDRYYSHRASEKNKDKLGQNFVGFYYI